MPGALKACDDMSALDAAIADAGEKLVLIDFHATWCGPCRAIAPFLEKKASEMTDVVFLKVDVDINSDAAEKYEIEAMPTFKFIKGGDVVATVKGADDGAIETEINKHK